MEYDIRPAESVGSAIVRTVAAVEGREQESLPPLAGVIDPAALDTLFDTDSSHRARIGARLEFYYSDSHITVDDGECITIQLLEAGRTRGGRTDEDTRDEQPTNGENGRSIRDGDAQEAGSWKQPGSRICVVCQQPIDMDEMQRERGELVHPECRAELRCGVSLGKRSGR